MEIRNRFPKTASGPESSFSLTRQAQTNRYDRRILAGSRGRGVRVSQQQQQNSGYDGILLWLAAGGREAMVCASASAAIANAAARPDRAELPDP
jgi:hypothetical protein